MRQKPTQTLTYGGNEGLTHVSEGVREYKIQTVCGTDYGTVWPAKHWPTCLLCVRRS
jgi:hypothetical protein